MGFFENKNKEPSEIEKKVTNFNATKKVENYIYINENKKQWALPSINFLGKVKDLKVYDYSDIIDFELIEDGDSIAKGGLGRAVVGGLLFGGVGAIVGGTTGKKKSKQTCSKLQIKITLNKIDDPVVYIDYITTEYKKNGLVYKTSMKFAQETMSILQVICNSNKTSETMNISNADEILKYKSLLDNGIITQEEFEKKKQELLN